ncbi:hypothetical protein PRZ48_000918 [Zasmidium cellare]|uniref:F-box domain-containing protein n=1 Tax=Zasmidium cellare TaxID=395010 RepID=A0ABR0EZT7_ZASCE|nr:hypothetical protein PRZ48_000918 [Zasmidium cellare]
MRLYILAGLLALTSAATINIEDFFKLDPGGSCSGKETLLGQFASESKELVSVASKNFASQPWYTSKSTSQYLYNFFKINSNNGMPTQQDSNAFTQVQNVFKRYLDFYSTTGSVIPPIAEGQPGPKPYLFCNDNNLKLKVASDPAKNPVLNPIQTIDQVMPYSVTFTHELFHYLGWYPASSNYKILDPAYDLAQMIKLPQAKAITNAQSYVFFALGLWYSDNREIKVGNDVTPITYAINDDDDTEQLGIQHWYLLAPTLKQLQKLPSTGGNGGHEQQYSDFLAFLSIANLSPKFEAFHRLAREPGAPLQHLPDASSLMQIADISILEALPAEILALVLNTGLLSMQDTLRLGSCSQTMWEHVRKHVQDDCRRATAPWAGTPIVAATNWLKEIPDMFKGILPEIEKELCQSEDEDPDLESDYARDWLAELISSSIEVTTKDRETEWLEAGEGLSANRRSSLSEAVVAHRMIVGDEWVLRNLTTSQFVRLEVRGRPEPAVMVAGSDVVTLDQLLLLNICWGVDSVELLRKRRLGFLRGKWAGHAFDVVRSNEFEGWQDVTLERLDHVVTALQGSEDKVPSS